VSDVEDVRIEKIDEEHARVVEPKRLLIPSGAAVIASPDAAVLDIDDVRR
jgi:hypothetical protein